MTFSMASASPAGRASDPPTSSTRAPRTRWPRPWTPAAGPELANKPAFPTAGSAFDPPGGRRVETLKRVVGRPCGGEDPLYNESCKVLHDITTARAASIG